MYALVEINGKQYKAEKDAVLKVDRYDLNAGDKIELDRVLLVSGDQDVKIGNPYVEGVKVNVVVEDNMKDKKIRIYTYKKRKGYHRTIGHRQQYTMIKVQDITGA